MLQKTPAWVDIVVCSRTCVEMAETLFIVVKDETDDHEQDRRARVGLTREVRRLGRRDRGT